MANKLKQIAIYGKGGIGKSTTTSNISAALAEAGYKVMQFGADPKADSTNTLRGGAYIPSVLDLLAERRRVDAYEAIFQGFGGIYCVEAGGPQPGVGCAGRGIITAVELLKQQRVFEELDLDYVIYDVLGDVVCGGFAVPVREGIAEHVFTVSSSDFMAVYAANNLFRGIERFSNSGGALLGGIIANSINTDFQRDVIDDFAARTATPIVQYVPRSLTVTQAELSGRTTIEAAPQSAQADIYRQLARRIAEHTESKVPTPLDPQQLREWSSSWADRLVAAEQAEAERDRAVA
ncbi:AAA family ATPase [Rhodopseudomonas palustris]|uniref:Nitrogenase iron protein n=1 Tax=Rhodopseudomonas palustris (strain ATCC BAA-98 / CGA009) TaxID=258594 RepID=Q6N7A5_RHOPA|nr:AAA family ATPase [Rhodopseudomonas palustris]OPF90378.1 nitrogenase iron protein [Rhodopseudomonas palustris]PPQ41433.1 nitrogenase iron protein [Rhodopseudomonas palustris]QQM03874.1 Nitrogenase iron protein 1 [Rhodopseudomonas palustris]RJF61937.1 nitrogenase iron protein [Rhodopseudomonas palustris]WAB80012.1 AAA family ATPase [Rhodopseudomonas palustris]